jgi:hypothetical protein
MIDHDHLRAPTLVRRGLPGIALLAATVALTACGGSSGGSAAASTTGSGNRAAISACLKKQGVSLPRRNPGNGGPPGTGTGPGAAPGTGNGPPPGLGLGGGGAGSSNPNRGKVQAALRKCGINFQRRGGGFRANNPAFRQALAKFTACVRKNGYNLPAPNTSGNGPVFSQSQVNRNDPKFIAASKKCQSLLPQRSTNGPPGAGQ